MKLVPLPAIQEPVPSTWYSQVAPVSSPFTLIVVLLVIPSVELVPLSMARVRVGAMGVVVSTLKFVAVCVGAALPATSDTLAVRL